MTTPESRTVERLAEALRGSHWAMGQQPNNTTIAYGPSDRQLLEEAKRLLAAAKEHGLVIGEGELDRAWKEAEEARSGWRVAMVNLHGDRETGYQWLAVAENGVDDWKANGYRNLHGQGPTPAAALKELARQLLVSRR